MQELAREFLEEFYSLRHYALSKTIGHAMKGEGFLLLYLLEKGEGASPGELSRALMSSSARIAAALNNLERKEWIVRLADKKDKRKTLVELTEEGRRQAEKCRRRPEGLVCQLMTQLGEEDSREILRILKRINAIVPQMECESCETEIKNQGGKDDSEI